jgi:hypothetical protein
MPSSRSSELGRSEFTAEPANLTVRFLEKPHSGPTYPGTESTHRPLFRDQLFYFAGKIHADW